MTGFVILLAGVLAAGAGGAAPADVEPGSAAEVEDFEALFAQGRFEEARQLAQDELGRLLCGAPGFVDEAGLECIRQMVRASRALGDDDAAISQQRHAWKTCESLFGSADPRTVAAQQASQDLWEEQQVRRLVEEGRIPEPRDPDFDRSALELGRRAKGESVARLWERLLAIHGSPLRAPDLHAALEPQDVLVTYLRYVSEPGGSALALPKMRYRAFLALGESAEPISLDLESSSIIEAHVRDLLTPEKHPSRALPHDVLRRDAERDLWRTLWQPIRARLGGRPHRFFVVLDGDLRRLDFPSLRDPQGVRLDEGGSTIVTLDREDELPRR